MQKRHLLSFVLTAAIATNASAAGYQLQEYSITNLGRAFAGAGVMGDDYSAIAFNPAGMSTVKQSGLQMGVTAVDVYGQVKGESTNKFGVSRTGREHSNLFRVMPHFYGQHKVNDKLDLGLGLYVPFGLANDYSNGWFADEQGG
ncbi:MAG: OmpP1/FadL family transporter, partial [Alphaproteobacteria bacterium]